MDYYEEEIITLQAESLHCQDTCGTHPRRPRIDHHHTPPSPE